MIWRASGCCSKSSLNWVEEQRGNYKREGRRRFTRVTTTNNQWYSCSQLTMKKTKSTKNTTTINIQWYSCSQLTMRLTMKKTTKNTTTMKNTKTTWLWQNQSWTTFGKIKKIRQRPIRKCVHCCNGEDHGDEGGQVMRQAWGWSGEHKQSQNQPSHNIIL